ncbi:MAG: polyprenyl synthetase family protein [Candidatus Bathyarchaeum sp.]|nr:MAG: polyprenyl synthetase family protein [Candidatus Bathyarchaeum sp.]
MLVERSKKSLEIAKKEILQEKRVSEEINDAFKYYAKAWYDVVHPGLVSIACEAVGGRADDTIPVQVAMLLLTAGFDVHDDIIDESRTKYGKPTVFAKFGKDITLLVGDAFLMKALVLLHKLEKQFPTEKINAIWDIINSLFFELGDAEALEASLKGNIDISPEEGFRILKMKASTFEAHMRIGAIVGGAEKDVVDLLGDYGRTMGILVSIREDFIDVFEDEELQNRFRNECLPLPILYAFKSPQTKRTIIDYLSKQRVSDEDAEKIVDMIYEDENVETFRNEVNQLAEEALTEIKNIPNKKLLSSVETLIKGIIEDL